MVVLGFCNIAQHLMQCYLYGICCVTVWKIFFVNSKLAILAQCSLRDQGGSMSQLVGLPNNSCKSITNTAWVRAWPCKLQKGVLDSQVKTFTSCLPMVNGSLWIFPASSTTKTGRHDIAEILLNVALNTKNQSIKSTM